MLMCYEKKYCGFCPKENCVKRNQKYNESNGIVPCYGNCNECKKAVRYYLIAKTSYIKHIDSQISSCPMYQFTKNEEIRFFGITGESTQISKTEMAILQLQKCLECKSNNYIFALKNILNQYDQIPKCFGDMLDDNIYDSLKELIEKTQKVDALKKCECKEILMLKSIIHEYVQNHNLNEREKIDINNLEEYVNSKNIDLNFYIHPVTLIYIIQEMHINFKTHYK